MLNKKEVKKWQKRKLERKRRKDKLVIAWK
jgi:hypothetical protein